jgi:uncharacterized membrane-anchored protein
LRDNRAAVALNDEDRAASERSINELLRKLEKGAKKREGLRRVFHWGEGIVWEEEEVEEVDTD